MRRSVCICLLAVLPAAAYAAVKPCEDLKTEIQARLDAKNVKNASLEIVAKDAAGTDKVVGSCEGGSKKIVYRRK